MAECDSYSGHQLSATRPGFRETLAVRGVEARKATAPLQVSSLPSLVQVSVRQGTAPGEPILQPHWEKPDCGALPGLLGLAQGPPSRRCVCSTQLPWAKDMSMHKSQPSDGTGACGADAAGQGAWKDGPCPTSSSEWCPAGLHSPPGSPQRDSDNLE